MYSTHNEGNSVGVERFIITLKNKTLKNMTSKSNNMYIDKLHDVVNKYNNTYHSTIKMKHVDVNLTTFINFGMENNDKGPKFKVGGPLRVSKHKSIFAKDYVSNQSKEVSVIKKVE